MRWILIALLALNVASCGQKGPLTLPESQLVTEPASSLPW